MGGFDVVDRNSDGVIDREEFDAMLLANTATTMATEAAAASHLGATMTSDAAASLLGTSALHDPEEDVTRAPVLRATGGEDATAVAMARSMAVSAVHALVDESHDESKRDPLDEAPPLSPPALRSASGEF